MKLKKLMLACSIAALSIFMSMSVHAEELNSQKSESMVDDLFPQEGIVKEVEQNKEETDESTPDNELCDNKDVEEKTSQEITKSDDDKVETPRDNIPEASKEKTSVDDLKEKSDTDNLGNSNNLDNVPLEDSSEEYFGMSPLSISPMSLGDEADFEFDDTDYFYDEAEYSGVCHESLYWYLFEDGLLAIRGSDTARHPCFDGYDYWGWYSHNADIKKVYVMPGTEISNASNMFIYCNATEISMPEGFCENATDMSRMFNSSNFKKIDFPSGFGKNAQKLTYMFSHSNIEEITFNDDFALNAIDANSMFSGTKVKSLEFPEGFGKTILNMEYMFNSSDIKELTLPDGFGEAATDIHGMFWTVDIRSLKVPDNFGANAKGNSTYFFRWYLNHLELGKNAFFPLTSSGTNGEWHRYNADKSIDEYVRAEEVESSATETLIYDRVAVETWDSGEGIFEDGTTFKTYENLYKEIRQTPDIPTCSGKEFMGWKEVDTGRTYSHSSLASDESGYERNDYIATWRFVTSYVITMPALLQMDIDQENNRFAVDIPIHADFVIDSYKYVRISFDKNNSYLTNDTGNKLQLNTSTYSYTFNESTSTLVDADTRQYKGDTTMRLYTSSLGMGEWNGQARFTFTKS